MTAWAEAFDTLERHELVTVRTSNGPDCTCGWRAETYTYETWQEHVWRSVLPAQYEASVGWLRAEQRAEIAERALDHMEVAAAIQRNRADAAEAEVARLREVCADYEAEVTVLRRTEQ